MNLQENIYRIKEVMGINETFENGDDPVLTNKLESDGHLTYVYTLPSKKSDKDYVIKLTFYKKGSKNFGKFSNLKNVMELDFNLGVGKYEYTGLNEIYYLFSSLKKVIDKHKKEFNYFIVHSSQDRLSLYEKALSRIDYLSLIEREGSHLFYKNNSFSKWF